MNASIVIPTYDRQDDLIECLQSVQGQQTKPEEIVVIDDGDTERTRRRLSEAGLADSVRHVEGDNDTLPASRNHGIEESSGEVVCFIDDDVILPPNWLTEIMSAYESGEEVMGVGGHVLNYNPQEINKANFDSLGYRVLTSLRLSLFYDRVGNISPVGILWAPHIFMTSSVRDVDALQGCNMSFRRRLVEEYEFSEWYGSTGSSACEELDFCARVSGDDHRLVYNPRASVLHKRTVSTGSRLEGPNYANITNLAYFMLSNDEMNLANFVLFASVLAVYSTLKFDAGYLKGMWDGIVHYLKESNDGGQG